MGARLSQDERRAVAERIFAALCAHCPERYVALVDPKLAASSKGGRIGAHGMCRDAQGYFGCWRVETSQI